MSPAAFAEIAVCLHGAVGLYRENRWLSLVRVADIGTDGNGAWAELEPIPTHGLRSDHDGGWRVYSIFDYLTVTPAAWGQSYPVVRIEFDGELVEAVVRFAASLPPGFSPEHYDRIRRFMSEFRSEDARAGG